MLQNTINTMWGNKALTTRRITRILFTATDGVNFIALPAGAINLGKESRPIADPALVCGEGAGFGLPPGGGALQDFALLNMILECWSNGVLKKRKSNTDLL
jgi:hypothetical protein